MDQPTETENRLIVWVAIIYNSFSAGDGNLDPPLSSMLGFYLA